MPTVKPFGKATNTVTSATDRLTEPLIGKIVGVLLGITLLLLLVVIVALFNLGQANEPLAHAAELQTQLSKLENLRTALQTEQQLLRQPLTTPGLDANLQAARNEFDTIFSTINQRGNSLYDVYFNHSKLGRQATDLVQQATTAPPSTDFSPPQNTLNTAYQNLYVSLDTIIRQQVDYLHEVLTAAHDRQEGGAFTTVVIAFGALLISGFMLWFIFHNVIGPLNSLNAKLVQLLWGQTEHLNHRLNQLQYQIDSGNSRLTAVRHDLKSPLGNVKGLAEVTLLTHPELNGDIRGNLIQIVEVADKGVALVSNILHQREIRLDLQNTNMHKLIDKVLQLVDLRMFNVKQDVQLDEAILDPALMEHLLLNLVSNARKFSQAGIGIGTRLVRKPGTVEEKEVELWVWNDGKTLTAAERVEIFKPGVQTEDGRKVGGHGLGLAIVKTIAEQHHGRVEVESHEKVGTTFRVIIPLLAVG